MALWVKQGRGRRYCPLWVCISRQTNPVILRPRFERTEARVSLIASQHHHHLAAAAFNEGFFFIQTVERSSELKRPPARIKSFIQDVFLKNPSRV
jgi:hypothetical protein